VTSQKAVAKQSVGMEFGADLDFHALRLHDTAEQAALDDQIGFDALGQQQRCSQCLYWML